MALNIVQTTPMETSRAIDQANFMMSKEGDEFASNCELRSRRVAAMFFEDPRVDINYTREQLSILTGYFNGFVADGYESGYNRAKKENKNVASTGA